MAYLPMQCVHNTTYVEWKNEVSNKLHGGTWFLSYIRYCVQISYKDMIL
jgi:hypothetical protein